MGRVLTSNPSGAFRSSYRRSRRRLGARRYFKKRVSRPVVRVARSSLLDRLARALRSSKAVTVPILSLILLSLGYRLSPDDFMYLYRELRKSIGRLDMNNPIKSSQVILDFVVTFVARLSGVGPALKGRSPENTIVFNPMKRKRMTGLPSSMKRPRLYYSDTSLGRIY